MLKISSSVNLGPSPKWNFHDVHQSGYLNFHNHNVEHLQPSPSRLARIRSLLELGTQMLCAGQGRDATRSVRSIYISKNPCMQHAFPRGHAHTHKVSARLPAVLSFFPHLTDRYDVARQVFANVYCSLICA